MRARAASPVEVDEMAAINAEMAAAHDDPKRLYDLNRQFHRALKVAARNRFLIRSMGAIEKTLLILGPTTLTDPARATEVVQEHASILTALANRDGAKAEAVMRGHIEAALRMRLRDLRLNDPEGEA